MYISLIMYNQSYSSPTEFDHVLMETFPVDSVSACPWLNSLSICKPSGKVTNISVKSADVVEQLYNQITSAMTRGDTLLQLDFRPYQK